MAEVPRMIRILDTQIQMSNQSMKVEMHSDGTVIITPERHGNDADEIRGPAVFLSLNEDVLKELAKTLCAPQPDVLDGPPVDLRGDAYTEVTA